MASNKSLLATAASGIRKVGLRRSLQAAVYPLRRAYHQARFSGSSILASLLSHVVSPLNGSAGGSLSSQPGEGAFSGLGPVQGWRQDGHRVTVRCSAGTLDISALAPDLIRVKVVNGNPRGPAHDYVIGRPEDEWEHPVCQWSETSEHLDLNAGGLGCRIWREPCRLSFLTSRGESLLEESQGAAWRDSRVRHTFHLAPRTYIYGLGERTTPLDRRGRRYLLWNQDPQVYGPGDDPIYLNVPFLIGWREGQGFGLHYGNTYRAELDVGCSSPLEVRYEAEDGGLTYYVFCGETLADITERYSELTGRMELPPLWALGYHQSRWSYYPDSQVRDIARQLRANHIPCDALHLDIHHMDGYRCFTWDRKRFPQPEALLEDLHDQGFKVVLIVDCGIKVDPHYAIYSQGLERGFFCTYPDGGLATGPVWPGQCAFPDFSDPKVRRWWGELHGPWVEAGVDGVWNDMNEPTVMGPGGDTLAGCVLHSWEGEGADHRRAHNIYGMEMVRACREGLERLQPDRRPFVLTRSGWAGVQRYAMSWTGDNESTWEQLRLCVPMVVGLGLSGVPITGPDIGGFEGHPDPELLLRWTQLGAFLPLFRNHTAVGTPWQEPWVHGEPYLSHNRAAIELRYRLLPYLYTATWQAARHGWPIARPMAWAAPRDAETFGMEDQFLCGDSLLVAPVGHPGALARDVYLPSGSWYDYWTDEPLAGPMTISAAAPLDHIPLFVRAGTVLPTWDLQQYVDTASVDRLILHVYPGDGHSWLYEDDGLSHDYRAGAWRATRFACLQSDDGEWQVSCHGEGDWVPRALRWEWILHAPSDRRPRVWVDGHEVTNAVQQASPRGWCLETGRVESLRARQG